MTGSDKNWGTLHGLIARQARLARSNVRAIRSLSNFPTSDRASARTPGAAHVALATRPSATLLKLGKWHPLAPSSDLSIGFIQP
jgi:hypothetical protein